MKGLLFLKPYRKMRPILPAPITSDKDFSLRSVERSYRQKRLVHSTSARYLEAEVLRLWGGIYWRFSIHWKWLKEKQADESSVFAAGKISTVKASDAFTSQNGKCITDDGFRIAIPTEIVEGNFHRRSQPLDVRMSRDGVFKFRFFHFSLNLPFLSIRT